MTGEINAQSPPKEALTQREKRLLSALRRLHNWVSDGQPSGARETVLEESRREIESAEAIDLS